jgi:hypothetical protein
VSGDGGTGGWPDDGADRDVMAAQSWDAAENAAAGDLAADMAADLYGAERKLRDVFTATYTYWVEILHPGADTWTHIHHPDWETSESYAETMIYAVTVRRDHPRSQVRIVERWDGRPDQYVPVP